MFSYIFIWSILSSGSFIIFAKYNIRTNIFLKKLRMYKILSLTEALTQWSSAKTSLFKNIAKVMGKHLCWNFFLIKLQASTTMEIFAKIVQSKILNGKLIFWSVNVSKTSPKYSEQLFEIIKTISKVLFCGEQ